MRKIFIWCLVLSLPLMGWADVEEPFTVEAGLEEQGGTSVLTVSFGVAPHFFLYAEMLDVVALQGATLRPEGVPAPHVVEDPFGGGQKKVYDAPFTLTYIVENPVGSQLDIKVSYQGCSHETCFFPEEKTFALPFTVDAGAAGSKIQDDTSDAGLPVADRGENWKSLAINFDEVGRDTGYMNTKAMLNFLQQAHEVDDLSKAGAPESRFEKMGLLTAVFLILLGGLALNFTPCVLPMIPINLAIIGAGAQAGSRSRGFVLGLAYGLAIALVYGVLGLVVVFTGATFGTLNASPWFNVVIAIIFILLALAMFDIFHIDLTRLQGRIGTPGAQKKGGHIWLAFSMGGVSALLAGACVAPVVISVLVWSNNLYSRGVTMGVLLPFVLGLGMALPWPFAGAGMQFLPKPGKWMAWVRSGFGVLILLLATYYAQLAWKQFTEAASTDLSEGSGISSGGANENARLAELLSDALKTGKPVLIDFGAAWCKNCTAMDKTTFKDDVVLKALEPYVFIKYAAENPKDPDTKAVLDYYNILGLPSFIVLRPAVDSRMTKTGV